MTIKASRGALMNIVDDIPVRLKADQVRGSLKIGRGTPYAERKIGELIDCIEPVMRPKAVYTESIVVQTGLDTVAVDGHVFTSRVLAKNLADQERCYPYVVTAGRELDGVELPEGHSPMLLNLIKNVVVEKAYRYTRALIAERHGVERVSGMSPGHLDWPLEQQRVLFDLLGRGVEGIGVSLTDAYLMVPVKSVSGILFMSETGFVSCRVCSQPRCMGRRTGYDPVAAKAYGL